MFNKDLVSYCFGLMISVFLVFFRICIICSFVYYFGCLYFSLEEKGVGGESREEKGG